MLVQPCKRLGNTVKLPGHSRSNATWYRLAPERAPAHRKETCGHGDNPVARGGNGQPNPPSFLPAGAVHRLDVGGSPFRMEA